MKLSRTVEYSVLAGLILYIGFAPRMTVVHVILSTPVGKVLALAGIVYVWKFVSAAVALLLAIMFVRCSGGGMTIWEGLEMPDVKCTCPEGHTFNTISKKCVDANLKEVDPESCACDPGYSYDFISKECKQNSVMSAPIPPAIDPEPIATAPAAGSAAPAVTAGPVTSTAPMTTPGAAQAMATSTAPAPSTAPAGPEATKPEKFTLMGYPLN